MSAVRDTSLGLEAFIIRLIEKIPPAKMLELRQRAQKLHKPTSLEVEGGKIKLTITESDIREKKGTYWTVSAGRGYATGYSGICDMLRYEKLGENFVDAILEKMRKVQYPD